MVLKYYCRYARIVDFSVDTVRPLGALWMHRKGLAAMPTAECIPFDLRTERAYHGEIHREYILAALEKAEAANLL